IAAPAVIAVIPIGSEVEVFVRVAVKVKVLRGESVIDSAGVNGNAEVIFAAHIYRHFFAGNVFVLFRLGFGFEGRSDVFFNLKVGVLVQRRYIVSSGGRVFRKFDSRAECPVFTHGDILRKERLPVTGPNRDIGRLVGVKTVEAVKTLSVNTLDVDGLARAVNWPVRVYVGAVFRRGGSRPVESIGPRRYDCGVVAVSYDSAHNIISRGNNRDAVCSRHNGVRKYRRGALYFWIAVDAYDGAAYRLEIRKRVYPVQPALERCSVQFVLGIFRVLVP